MKHYRLGRAFAAVLTIFLAACVLEPLVSSAEETSGREHVMNGQGSVAIYLPSGIEQVDSEDSDVYSVGMQPPNPYDTLPMEKSDSSFYPTQAGKRKTWTFRDANDWFRLQVEVRPDWDTESTEMVFPIDVQPDSEWQQEEIELPNLPDLPASRYTKQVFSGKVFGEGEPESYGNVEFARIGEDDGRVVTAVLTCRSIQLKVPKYREIWTFHFAATDLVKEFPSESELKAAVDAETVGQTEGVKKIDAMIDSIVLCSKGKLTDNRVNLRKEAGKENDNRLAQYDKGTVFAILEEKVPDDEGTDWYKVWVEEDGKHPKTGKLVKGPQIGYFIGDYVEIIEE